MAYRPTPEEFLHADQGALFEAFVRRPKPGRTVQLGDQGNITIEVPEGSEPYYAADDSTRGIYGDAQTISISALHALEDAAQDATRKNRRAQRGRHSARDPETHRYEEPRVVPGKVLPPLNNAGSLPLAVTDSNPESVTERTAVLNETADAFNAENPQLGDEQSRPTAALITHTAEQMDLNRQIYFVDVNAESFRGDEKIRMVLTDERAGFIPMTNEEKDIASLVLTSDFSDSSDRERAVMNVLKMRGYIEAAQRDANALAWLKDIVDSVDTPQETLQGVISSTGAEDSEQVFEAVTALSRHIDIADFLSGKEEFTFRPMASRPDPAERSLSGKNGSMHDSYRAAFLFKADDDRLGKQYEEIRNRVMRRYEQSSAVGSKNDIALAILNQRRRIDFWRRYSAILDKNT